MRIRSAQTLVFVNEGDHTIGFNYLTRSYFACSRDLLTFLSMVRDWTPFGKIRELLGSPSARVLQRQLSDLIDVNAVVVEDGDIAGREDDYRERWAWGMPTALFHQTVQDRPYLTETDNTNIQRARLETDPPPALFLKPQCRAAERIPLPDRRHESSLLDLMARRRTRRTSTGKAITLNQLNDCLFAGMGITGETINDAGITLPLGMTPSGGARNPFEAYVYALDVNGLPRGFYHYCAADQVLEPVATNRHPNPSELLGSQDWSDLMPCIIILCAFFERTMWKYADANAYRVILIEAGHIGQNIMLLATQHGLTACPTAAINHAQIGECLGLDTTLMCAPVYALTLSEPLPDSSD